MQWSKASSLPPLLNLQSLRNRNGSSLPMGEQLRGTLEQKGVHTFQYVCILVVCLYNTQISSHIFDLFQE